MLARNPVKRALQPTGQAEIVGVHGQQLLFLRHPFVDPVGQSDAQGSRLFGDRVNFNVPFINPGEAAVPAPFGAQRRKDGGRCQTVERGAKLLIALPAGVALNGAQQVIGGGAQRARQIIDALLLQPVQGACCPDQNIGVPDGGHAVGRDGFNLDPYFAIGAAVINGLEALALLQREEGPLHRLPLILQRDVVHHRDKEIELRIIFASRGHSCLSLSNIAPLNIVPISRARGQKRVPGDAPPWCMDWSVPIRGPNQGKRPFSAVFG